VAERSGDTAFGFLRARWRSRVSGGSKAPSSLRFAGALHDDFAFKSGWRRKIVIVDEYGGNAQL
jgi:hypothetical protein